VHLTHETLCQGCGLAEMKEIRADKEYNEEAQVSKNGKQLMESRNFNPREKDQGKEGKRRGRERDTGAERDTDRTAEVGEGVMQSSFKPSHYGQRTAQVET